MSAVLKYSLSWILIPGLKDLSEKRRGRAFGKIIFGVLPLLLIGWNFQWWMAGWSSLALTIVLAIVDRSALGALFNSGVIEYQVASVFITAWVAGWWMWNYHALRIVDHSETMSPWQLATRAFRKNRFAMVFMLVTLGMYAVAFLSPWLAPNPPNEQQDIVVTKYAHPMSQVSFLRLKPVVQELPYRSGEQLSALMANKLLEIHAGLLRHSDDLIFIDAYTREGSTIHYIQGIQKKSLPLGRLVSEKESEFAGRRTYWLGSDRYGRDILSRLIYGSRISLTIGLLAMAIAVTLGTVIGATAGYFGSWTDSILMRGVDVLMAFPNLFLILMVVALFGNSIFGIIAILGATGWMGVSRVVRGQVLSVREMEYVRAAQALGFSHARVLFVHVIPNVLAPVIVAATLRLGVLILVEAGLSFLGVGVSPPTASWGNMISEGRDTLLYAWWISTFPGLAIVLTVVSFNIVGDGLRDALDPKLRS